MLPIQQQSLQKHNSTLQTTFEHNYKNITNLLSSTRSRTPRKGIQLHAQIIKLGLQIIPLFNQLLLQNQAPDRLTTTSRRNPYQIINHLEFCYLIFRPERAPGTCVTIFQKKIFPFGVRPDDYIFPSATKAHQLRFFRVMMWAGVVDVYAKCGRNGDARKVFDEMPVRNVVSSSGMIYGYAQLFKQALFERFEVNDFTFMSVIRVCGNTTLLGLGKRLHRLCLKLSFGSSSFVGSSLIFCYNKYYMNNKATENEYRNAICRSPFYKILTFQLYSYTIYNKYF
ncbi:putative tetratricopeptide-like helical domain superfamily [Helianthus anomalus]